jgi:hypothetical protein
MTLVPKNKVTIATRIKLIFRVKLPGRNEDWRDAAKAVRDDGLLNLTQSRDDRYQW